MPIKRVDRLDDGLNELMNPENLPPGGLQESSNYEILGDGKITKRKDPVEYGDDVSGDSLKTKLAAIFTQSILQISPPYYPVKKLSDMTGDFLILVYGAPTAGTYELYMCYENDSNTWTVNKVDITGITYTADTYLEFFIGDDKLIITDTYNETTNFPHYVKVDADGELITGLFSIKSPTNKATLEPTTEYDSSEFEEDTDDVHLDDCGIVQCVYTVVSKDGDESNPSPISNSKMMQFFKKDLVDKNDIRWIDSFQITNLSVPVLTGDLTEELKYFYVYFRVIRYSEGEAAEPFYFSKRYKIVDKENNTGDTGNGYLVNVPQDESILLSYENDIAPYAKHAAEVSGIVGLANIREKTRFPFNFEKYCPVLINNVNNKNFVDAIVSIRLYDKNSGEADLIDDLDLSYYDATASGLMTNLNLIRIYDEDKITPIKVSYVAYNGAKYLDVYVKVPLLTAGQIKYLYLCFNTEDGTEEGVNIEARRTTEYGEFTVMSSATVSEMFYSERVKSNKTVICSPMDYLKDENEILNLADDNNNGDIHNDDSEWVAVPTKQLMTGYDVGTGSVNLKSSDVHNVSYDEMPFETIPQRLTMWGRVKYDGIFGFLAALPVVEKFISIYNFKIGGAFREFGLDIIYDDSEETSFFALTVKKGDPENFSIKKLVFDELPLKTTANYFICISIDRDESASLYIGDLTTGSYFYQKVNWDNWRSSEPTDVCFEDVRLFGIMWDIHTPITAVLFSAYHSQFQMTINKYYDADNDNDLTAIYNIANFMPGFETALGQKITTEE